MLSIKETIISRTVMGESMILGGREQVILAVYADGGMYETSNAGGM